MRPAFVVQLGEEGQHMADHDRQDHDKAKNELLALFKLRSTRLTSRPRSTGSSPTCSST